MDTLFSGCVHVRNVKLKANLKCAYIEDSKLLQASSKQVVVNENIPADRVIKHCFLDTIKVFQGLKKLFDTNYEGGVRDPVKDCGDTPAPAKHFLNRPQSPTTTRWLSGCIHATNTIIRTPTRMADAARNGSSNKLEEPTV